MSLYALYTVLGIASVWDLKTLRIPNALILFGLSVGIGLSIYEHGWAGLKLSLLGILLVFLTLFPVWAAKTVGLPMIGAGDVKLYMVVGAFLGYAGTMSIFLWSIILGGVLFLVSTHPKRILQIFQDFFYLVFYFLPPVLTGEKKKKKISFALPILVVTVILTQGFFL